MHVTGKGVDFGTLDGEVGEKKSLEGQRNMHVARRGIKGLYRPSKSRE